MPLSFDILSQFAKITNNNTKPNKKESFAYGQIYEDEKIQDKYYVVLDGASSDIKIPVSRFTATVNKEEKVIVMIKNHSAIITGNISSQAAGTAYVNSKFDEISSVDIEDIKALWNK